MTNMSYPAVTTVLNPSTMKASSNVILPANTKINTVDLDTDALTFRTNDEKTFTNHVKMTGGLKVVPGSTSGDLSIASAKDVVLLDADETTELLSVNLPQR